MCLSVLQQMALFKFLLAAEIAGRFSQGDGFGPWGSLGRPGPTDTIGFLHGLSHVLLAHTTKVKFYVTSL